MLTVNQLTMQRLAPRDRETGDCFIKALTFCLQGKTTYVDIEEKVMREQPAYNPRVKRSGVYGTKFLGRERVLYGRKFTLESMHVKHLPIFLSWYVTGTYLVINRNHAYVVKDGEVFDGNTIKWNEPIVAAWKVENLS